MKLGGYHTLGRGLIITVAIGAFASTALESSSLSQPGQEIKEQEPKRAAEVENAMPERSTEGQEIRFTVRGIDLVPGQGREHAQMVRNALRVFLDDGDFYHYH